MHRIWQSKTSSTVPLNRGIRFGDGLVIFSDRSIYTFSAGVLTSRYTTAGATINIKSFCIHKNTLYVGLSNGVILSSSAGVSWTAQATSSSLTTVSIESLVSYKNNLYIGTSTQTDGYSYVYTNFGAIPVTAFSQASVRCMAVLGSYLFVGTGGPVNQHQGAIYMYDGTTWGQSLSTTVDAVETMMVSTLDSRLWVALESGAFYAMALNSSGNITSWVKVYDGDNKHTYSIANDPNGQFLWLNTDTGTIAYVASTKTFTDVAAIAPTIHGLRTVWTNSDANNFTTLGQGSSSVVLVDGPVNWTNLASSRPTGVNATNINAHWEGFIVAPSTEAYTFTLIINDGARLYIDDNLIIDAWEIRTGQATVTGIANMISGQFTKIRLEYFQGNDADSNPGIVLKWQSTSMAVPFAAIPLSALYLPTLVSDIQYIGNNPYGIVHDENIYAFDTTSVGTKDRIIYVRFQDTVGNATSLSTPYTDDIIEDVPTVNGVRISDGRIYQVQFDKTIASTFISPVAAQLRGPDRRMRQSGYYTSDPFYAPTLTHWDMISFLATLPAGAILGNGLDRGVQIDLRVRTADTRQACLAAPWGPVFTRSTIGNPSGAGDVDTSGVNDFNISAFNGKWLQFSAVLTTASPSTTPVLKGVVLTYKAAEVSYFFTTMFDTANYSAATIPPEFRRFLFTSNQITNGGEVVWGYTTDATADNTFDFTLYQTFEPNTTYELPSPSSKIRFGAFLMSVMDPDTPATLFPYASCVAATTANITLSGLQTIDGVAVTAGNRVLVKNQSSGQNNGIYVVASGSWSRSADTMVNGAFVSISGGTTNNRQSFVLKTANPITTGTTVLSWILFSAAAFDDFAVQLDAGPNDPATSNNSDMQFKSP